MSTWGKVILTKQGEALLNQCLGMSGHYNLNQSNDPDSDTKGIVITRVSTGRYRYTNTSVEYLKERTDLATSDGATGGTSGFVENLNITGLKPITSSNSDQYGQALIQVQLDNQREDRNIKEEYPLGQLGVFARLEGSTEEILFTIVQYAGDTLPVIPAPVTPTLLNFGFYIAIATTETVSIEMEFTGIVTAKQFDDYKLVTDETLNTLNEHTKNTENPHKVTAQQVGLGNVPNVTTDNQTPTFTQSSTLSEINSGEKLSTLFGKIKKAIVDLISHLANTNNPHSVTKSQVGLGNVDDTSDADKPISTATKTALDGKAPKTHASSSLDYGIGDREVYGHLRLFNGVNSTADTRSGFAATPNAVKTAYEKAVEGVNAAEKAQETANSKLDKGFISNGYTGIDEVTARLNGIEEGAEVNKVTSVQGRTGDVTVTKADIDLGNVPNVTTNNQTPTFTAASSRTNINSGETLATIFGKIKKWFSDLKTIAFTGSYTDLLNKPTSMQNPNSLTLTMNGSSSSYDGSATASKSWYAPTSGGTAGYNLISNGSGAPVWQQPPYAECTTQGNVAAKTVSISNFRLVIGARIVVKFNLSHTSKEGATLNVSNTGAKPIIKFGARAFFDNDVTSYIPITSSKSWSAFESLELVYDGTHWVIVGSSGYTSGGRNSSVITIGSTTDEVEGRYVDYMCNRYEDAGIVIQKAIDLLPDSGGKIILLEGTYYLSTQLTHSKNIIIEGQGKGITKINTSNKVLISKTSETSATAVFKNMDIDFACRTNWSPDVGVFCDYTSLEFDNCSITYANTLHNTDSLFKNCNVKLSNSKITVTLPAKRYDSSHVCWWVFRDCTVELTNTGILFPSGSNNTLSNGVFYACNGTMFGGFIQHIGTAVSGINSYVESLSVISFVGTQIECRKFSQVEESTGDFNTLSNCRIKILQASGYFNASHISHCDFYIAGAIIFCAYCMASNCKLWFSATSLATLRNYCYFEACYVNQSTWISSQGTGVLTTDTKTGIGLTAPSFRSVS